MMRRVLRLILICATLAVGARWSAAERAAPLPDAPAGGAPALPGDGARPVSVPGGTVTTPNRDVGPVADVRNIPERIAPYVPPMMIEQHSGVLKPRRVCERDFYLNVVESGLHNLLIVKFTEESQIRWSGGLYSKSGAKLDELSAFLAAHPDLRIRRESNTLSEELLDYWEANGERNTGKDLANLNNYYVIEADENPDPLALIKEVIAIDLVETAFYLPPAQEACTDLTPDTPDWRANQTYQDPAPLGIDADFAWAYHSGGAGHNGAWTVDIENDWTEDHEDFNTGFSVLGGGDNGNDAAHGDAVVGVFAACNNGADGMTGISYNVTPKGCSWSHQSGSTSEQWANAFNIAASWLLTGESYLIEIHWPGPDPGFSCDAGCGNCDQFQYIAVEYWQNAFDAIETHTANGIIVYEAAGNGQMNLDNAVYGDRFDRTFRDSDAIVVGAGTCDVNVDAMCWSNYGSRLDLSGWGQCVYTLGYGDLWMGSTNRNQWYTDSFGGTSSATPIVTGAGNCLQGIAQDKYGVTLTPVQMASYMATTGTPWGGARDIGERPDLEMAINRIEPDVYPAIPSGWSYSFTPRDNNTATEGSCLISTVLDGNQNTTYLNFAGYNAGPTPAPDSDGPDVYTELYIDNVFTYWVGVSPTIPQNSWQRWNNWGPITVRGGRHETRWWLDPDDAFNEESETNNWIYRQFVWSPYNLSWDAGLARSAPPLKDWGSPTYLSGDGFHGDGTYWTVCAVLPQSGNDVDLYSYANSYSSTSGFDTPQASSSAGSGLPDLVAINGRVLGYGQDRLFQAIRYADGSTANYAIESDAALTIAPGYTGTFTLDANDVVDFYEFSPGAGTSVFCGITDLSPGLDLKLVLFGPGGSYYDILDGSTVNDNGAGGDEFFTIGGAVAGYYGLAVIKSSSAMYGQSGDYTIIYQAPQQVNLQPGTHRTGWDEAAVFRNTNDATVNDAQFPAAIQGNTTNYVSVTWFNAGGASTSAAFANRVVLDNTIWTTVNNVGALGPFDYHEQLNVAVANVRGGRHAFALSVDEGNIVTEQTDGDNVGSAQYVWSPLALARNAPVLRNAPPLQGSFPNPNSDGFSYVPAGNTGNAVALLPVAITADYDMNYYDDYTGSTDGFSVLFGSSSYGAGAPDYVYVGYTASNSHTPYYPGVINFDGEGTNVWIEADDAGGRISYDDEWSTPNPDTLGNGSIINVYEFPMTAGVNYTITCDVISGTADIGLRLFSDGNVIQPRVFALDIANAAGAGADEVLNYTPSSSGFYALVVEKTDASQAGLTAIYTLDQSFDPPATVDDLVITPVMFFALPIRRLDWGHINATVGGAPLGDHRYVIYRSSDFNLAPLPADSIGGTTDSTFYDFSSLPVGAYFYRVKVKTD